MAVRAREGMGFSRLFLQLIPYETHPHPSLLLEGEGVFIVLRLVGISVAARLNHILNHPQQFPNPFHHTISPIKSEMAAQFTADHDTA